MDTLSPSNRLKAITSKLGAATQMLGTERRRLSGLKTVAEKNRTDIEDFSKAIELCRACIAEQVSAKEHIEKLATSLLRAVMHGVWIEKGSYGKEDDYEFFLDPVYGGDGALNGLNPLILLNGISDAPKNYGDGIQNLISFAIRLAYLLLNPDLSQVLVFDEPMVNLSPFAWRYVVQFLESLQLEVPLQVICITHSGAEFPVSWNVWREGETSRAKLAA